MCLLLGDRRAHARNLSRLQGLGKGGSPVTGAQLRAWRLRLPATQLELSAELGVDRATVSRLERQPEINRRDHIALAYVASTWRHPLPQDPD
jgi:DNA-binding XRE family transcriptional regulator